MKSPVERLRKPKEDSNFLVVGLVRNAQKTLPEEITRLKGAIGEIKSLHWLLVESDSRDDTVTILEQLRKSTDNFKFIKSGSLKQSHPTRVDRITFCRNLYLEQINKSEEYSHVDYVIVADLDNVNTKIDEQAINSCWNTPIDWDMCAANQDGPYYDIWALRHQDWSPNDCWEQYNFLKKLVRSERKALQASISSRMIRVPREHDWIEVESAFGGLAIYKKKMFEGCTYNCRDKNGTKHCEHVHLHRMMRERGFKLFINPKLINTDFTEHSKHAGIYYRILNNLDIFR